MMANTIRVIVKVFLKIAPQILGGNAPGASGVLPGILDAVAAPSQRSLIDVSEKVDAGDMRLAI